MGKKRVAIVKEESPEKKATVHDGEVSHSADTKGGKKKKRTLERANIYVQASYNNTKIMVSGENGDVIAWTTAGAAGFKGPRKATPYAASRVVDLIFEKIESLDIKEVHVLVKGIGSGRDSALRALTSRNLNVMSIIDITPIPHNGCRPVKRRRV